MKFLFINGVNLNMTGVREKGVYGEETLDEINAQIAAHFKGEFRNKSVLSEVCKGVICGFGKNSYILAAESFKL